jgi:O-acetyl-ADP-ribose deacetylase (regulator of RNase III)
MTRFPIGRGALIVTHGDITAFDVDAVVNAANSRLAGGGGVDGAIHRAAGPGLPEACREIIAARGQVRAGEAAITPGFAMKARHIIHAVGPIWSGGNAGEPEALAQAYRACLELCREHQLSSVAFPAISCGAYGFPVELAAPIAIGEIRRGLEDGLVREAFMTLYSPDTYETWLANARRIL